MATTHFPAYLLLPFAAALIFATSSLCFKRAFQEGASPTRSLMLTNMAMGLIFLPLFVFDSRPFSPFHVGWPILAGVLFFLGQGANFAALRFGDVSLATPIMGCKVVMVALCARVLFDFPLTTRHWTAAGLTSLGVVVLSATDFHRGGRIGLTSGLALVCCLCFSLVDTVIQRGAPDFGAFNFLAAIFATLGLISALLWPWVGRPEVQTPERAHGWLIGAILLTAAQGLLMTLSIGIWQDATGVNVVYSLRGVWGVVLVGLVGRWFGNTERHDAGARTLWFRFAGAAIILLAVVLTFANAKSPQTFRAPTPSQAR